jgi:hypothetical protein
MARRGFGRAALGSGVGAFFSLAVLFGAQAAPAVSRVERGVARSASSGFSFSTQPALEPAFAPSIPDYVTRCDPADVVTVSVSDSGGTPVSVDRQPVDTRGFRTRLKIGPGQGFVVRTPSASYTVRCLPSDFPRYTAQIFGQPQAAYYLMTPSSAVAKAPAAPYVVLFDAHGVPVWWYGVSGGAPVDASLLPDGDLAWDLERYSFNKHNATALTYQTLNGFGLPSGTELDEYRLDGTPIRKLATAGTPTDFHTGLGLPGGTYLMTSYALRSGANLSPVFGGTGNVLDATFQVVSSAGTLLYSWDAAGRIVPAESVRWRSALDFAYPGVTGSVWDYQHIDSVVPDGDGYLISLQHTDAVYLVRASDGSIEWKLGGTPTFESLTIIGDPNAARDFGGPTDAQVWPDGTVSVLDNGTNRGRAPRVLRFRIDAQARTATLIQTITDPLVSASACCGSARLLPGGDWVVDWGNTQVMDELNQYDQAVLRLTLGYPYYSYGVIPILPGQLRLGALEAGMNAITPRTPSGANPPALAHLRVSYAATRGRLRVRFTLAWRARVRFSFARCASTNRKRCQRVGSRYTVVAQRGANAFVLKGWFAGRRLGPGDYRLTATPMTGSLAGRSVSATFRVGP